MSRRSLQREVWGNMSVSEKSLDVHILNLRKKLIMAGLKISFVPPGSFRLEESGGCEMAALGSMDPKDQVG